MNALRIYLLPAAVFQSVMIGGGYGTGREVVEFFTRHGGRDGLLGIAVATVGFAIVLALSFDLARVARAYDYRSFVRALAGRFWIAYETLYLLLAVLVLAVVGAAASETLTLRLGFPPFVGAAVLLAIVALMVFCGRELVLRALTAWALLLSLIFTVYFVLALGSGPSDAGSLAGLGPDATHPAGSAPDPGVGPDGAVPRRDLAWVASSLQYVCYNVALAPVLLFAVRAIATRRQAFVSGGIAAVAAMVPALLFHLSFLPHLPEIASHPLPVYRVIELLGSGVFMTVFAVGLVGTLVQTGVGLIHGVLERIDGWRAERGTTALGGPTRAAVALGIVGASAAMSSAGIITLIARGYGWLAWGFLLVYVLPLCAWGLRSGRRTAIGR